MIDDQIKTLMASDQFRRRAAELEPETRADIALGKPVNLAAVPDELALGVPLARGIHHAQSCAMARPHAQNVGAQ
jgi:hypothetical protein